MQIGVIVYKKIYRIMKKVLVVAMLIVLGMVALSCNTYKPCPAYGGHSAVECEPIADQV